MNRQRLERARDSHLIAVVQFVATEGLGAVALVVKHRDRNAEVEGPSKVVVSILVCGTGAGVQG